MDNWGDPWADHDNAQSAKSPSKPVTSPQLPTFAPAPTVLNGFLDDAGWGNEDDDFGDWSTPVGNVAETPQGDTRDPEPTTHEIHNQGPIDDAWDTAEKKNTSEGVENGEWAVKEADTSAIEDREESNTPGSPTTNDRNDNVPTIAPRAPGSLASDSSEHVELEEPTSGTDSNSSIDDSDRDEDETNALHSEDNATITTERAADTAETSDGDSASEEPSPITHAKINPKQIGGYVIDQHLFSELFPPSKKTKDLEEAPEDPIYSTAGRKAWYRLTRKQTLREFNNGNDDDNYVRVTWGTSNIRSEVNKIVGRWAREDRISGIGPGARASFYWDTPAPAVPALPKMHNRHQSVMAAAPKAPMAPNRQSLPPLSRNNKAAFDWSSPSSSKDPWQSSTASTGKIMSPIASTPTMAMQNNGPLSIDATIHGPNQISHAPNLSAHPETPIASTLISPPPSKDTSSPSDPWAGPDSFDKGPTSLAINSAAASADAEDDDDWGEMVTSPTVSTPVTESLSQATTRNNTLSTTATPPQSVSAVPVQDQSPDTMYATPIVRLKSTVSPTSALFRGNTFVPLGTERGPIGPGILKPVNSSVRSSSQKIAQDPPAAPQKLQPSPDGAQSENTIESDPVVSIFSEHLGTSTPESRPTIAPAESATPPVSATLPAKSTSDGWADVDLSFFESAPSVAAPSVPVQDTPRLSPSSQSPPRKATTKPFARSPPRHVTPPPLQPLSGATSSAQQRKAEEDRILQDIISGFPDLSYMLR